MDCARRGKSAGRFGATLFLRANDTLCGIDNTAEHPQKVPGSIPASAVSLRMFVLRDGGHGTAADYTATW